MAKHVKTLTPKQFRKVMEEIARIRYGITLAELLVKYENGELDCCDDAKVLMMIPFLSKPKKSESRCHIPKTKD